MTTRSGGPLAWKEKDPELYKAWLEAQTAILMGKADRPLPDRRDWKRKDPELYDLCLWGFRQIAEELYKGEFDIAKMLVGGAIETLAPGTGWKWTDQELARAFVEEAEIARKKGDKGWAAKALEAAMAYATDAAGAAAIAVSSGRRGGKKRAKKLSGKRRKEIAIKAARARWRGTKKRG